jgi:tetratricopeptide (TPR) repeat protein
VTFSTSGAVASSSAILRRHVPFFARNVRRLIVSLLLTLAAPALLAREASLVDRALEARAAGRYSDAISLLERERSEQPNDLRAWVLLGETLGWARRFAEAEVTLRAGLERFSQSTELAMGLAQTLSWEKKFAESAAFYRRVLARNPHAREALAGAARNEYWEGETRASMRHFKTLLQIDPSSAEARRTIAEIRAGSRTSIEIGSRFVDDDQPYRRSLGEIGAAYFSDPQTRWKLNLGSEALEAGSGSGALRRSATAPYGSAGVRATFAPFTLDASIERMRFPDATTEWLGALRLGRSISPGLTISAGVDRQALLATATAIDAHPYVTSSGASLTLGAPSQWLAGASASHLAYFDSNSGVDVNGYLLAPVGGHAWLGVSAGWRDTSESRFIALATGGGIYRPYWTPQNLREARAVLAASVPAGPATLALHLDGGIARDEIPSFTSAGTQIPRTFHPWRASASLDYPISGATSLLFGYERNVTVFYAANELHATLARRF